MRHGLLFAAIATASLVGKSAFADDNGARADALFNAGKALVADGKLAEGRAKYAEAYSLKPSADIACNLGSTELELKDYAPAATHLEVCIRIFPATGTAEQRAAADKRLAQAKAEVAAVKVTANKDGASINVDGVKVGQTPMNAPVFVAPGHHEFLAHLDGFSASPTTLEASRGQTADVSLNLSADTSAGGGKRPIWPGIVGLSLGVVALGIGGGLIGLHGSQLHDAKMLGNGLRCTPSQLTTNCQAVADKMSSAQTSGDAGFGLLVGGGVVVAAGASVLIWALVGPSGHDDSSKQGALTVLPVVAPHAGGLLLGRTF